MGKKNEDMKQWASTVAESVAESVTKGLLQVGAIDVKTTEKLNSPEATSNKDYFEKKHRESEITNAAFINLVKKLDLLENSVKEQGDEIEALNDKIQKIKRIQKKSDSRIKKLIDHINNMQKSLYKLKEKIQRNKENINKLLFTVRNILCLSDVGYNIKKSDILLVSQKLVRRKEKEQRKMKELIKIDDDKR